MRLARLVSTRQEGTKVFYRLAKRATPSQLVADAIHQAEHSLGTAPNHGMARHCGQEK